MSWRNPSSCRPENVNDAFGVAIAAGKNIMADRKIIIGMIKQSNDMAGVDSTANTRNRSVCPRRGEIGAAIVTL